MVTGLKRTTRILLQKEMSLWELIGLKEMAEELFPSPMLPFRKEAFKRLTNSDYYFTVNVFSARRVFKDNILDGGYAEGHISDATKSPIQIKCDFAHHKIDSEALPKDNT